MPNVIQVRVADSAIAVLEDDPAALVSGILGGEGLTFDVPADCGDPAICCEGGTQVSPCGPIEIDLEERAGDQPRLDITLVQGASHVDVVIRARVRTQNPIPFETNGIGCEMSVDTEPGDHDHLRMDLSMDLPIDAVANTTRVEITRAEVSQLTADDLTIGGNFLCGLGDLDFVKDLVIDQLIGTLEDTMRETIEDSLCKTCPSGDVADCGGFADSCADQVCMRSGSCVQELGMSTRARIASLVAGVSSGHGGSLDIYDVAGEYTETDGGGVSLGVLGGMLPAATDRDRCGPPATRPQAPAVARSSFFSGNTRPDTNAGFDLAVGVHKHNLELFAWAGYESGLFCLNIGTRTVELLNTDALGLLFPSIGELTHGQTAPVILGLRPQNPPAIVLGTGTTAADPESGEQTIEDPLLDVTFEKLEIDFYVMVDDQFIRVLTATTDVRLPINLEVDENGEIAPVIGDVDDAISNVSVSNAEALLESTEELEAKFPLLLELALPQLGSSLGSFALPDVGGVQFRVTDDGITSVEDKTFLAIFAELVPPGAMASAPPADVVTTTAAVTAVSVPPAEVLAAAVPNRARGPVVDLALGGVTAGGDGNAELEWSFRVDGGGWSPYTASSRVRLSRGALWLQGRHRIDVRGRVRGRPETVDPTPATVFATVDRVAPAVRLVRTAYGVSVIGHDGVSRERVRTEYHFGDGEWLSAGNTLPVHIALDGRSASDLAVRVVDESNNQAMATPGVAYFHGAGEAAGCECSGAGDPRSAAGAVLLTVLAIALSLQLSRRRRRRRGWLPLAIALVVPWAPGCSCEGSDPQVCAGEGGECLEGEVERGSTGRWASIAVAGDRAVATGYEEELGDLVLIELSADGAPESYRVIDGFPTDVKPTYEPTTYRGGIAEEGDDVGAWTSVALRDGLAIVAYQDVTNGQLKLAIERDDGTFHVEVVDAADGAVSVGQHASVHVRADGTPTVAYMALGVADADTGGVVNELRFAEASSRSPVSASDWTITTVDAARVSCSGLCSSDRVCAADDPDQGAEGERCVAPQGGCEPGCGDDQVCLGSRCADVVDSDVYDLPGGVGLFATNLELADGAPAIVYYDRARGDLVASVFRGAWNRQDLDVTTSADTGHAATAVAGADGTVHIAYQDAIGDRLLYTTWDGNAVGAVEIVDDGVREGEPRTRPVGAGAAIFAGADGAVGVAFQDASSANLLLGERNSGSWAVSNLESGSQLYGFHLAAGSDAGRSLIASYRYDRTTYPSGDLVISTVPSR